MTNLDRHDTVTTEGKINSAHAYHHDFHGSDLDAPCQAKENVKTPPGVSPKREEKPSPSDSACEDRLCSSLCY